MFCDDFRSTPPARMLARLLVAFMKVFFVKGHPGGDSDLCK